MNNNETRSLSELEQEFNAEVKGYGSLSLQLMYDSDGETDRIGYHIRPEDIEALYFEGIGIPRWESIKADNVDEQLKIYNESMQEKMVDYPLINRVNDTDKQVIYKDDEISPLLEECSKISENAPTDKAQRAVKKFAIACEKAAEKHCALHLNPC